MSSCVWPTPWTGSICGPTGRRNAPGLWCSYKGVPLGSFPTGQPPWREAWTSCRWPQANFQKYQPADITKFETFASFLQIKSSMGLHKKIRQDNRRSKRFARADRRRPMSAWSPLLQTTPTACCRCLREATQTPRAWQQLM